MYYTALFSFLNQRLYIVVVKNKIQLRKFEDLLGFIHHYMNWAAPQLVISKELWEAEEIEGFWRQTGGKTRKS